jgi:hypothetical protein
MHPRADTLNTKIKGKQPVIIDNVPKLVMPVRGSFGGLRFRFELEAAAPSSYARSETSLLSFSKRLSQKLSSGPWRSFHIVKMALGKTKSDIMLQGLSPKSLKVGNCPDGYFLVIRQEEFIRPQFLAICDSSWHTQKRPVANDANENH